MKTAVSLAASLATLAALAAATAPAQAAGLAMKTGVYRCELNRSVHVRHVSADARSAKIRWGKRDYTLHAVSARTGALRYEDPKSGLMWLTIVGKSMLLDTKHGKQLANECRA